MTANRDAGVVTIRDMPTSNASSTGSIPLGRAEVLAEVAGVEIWPGFIGVSGGVVAVELHQCVHQMAPNRSRTEQLGQLGEIEQPVRVPRSPVFIGTVGDAVDAVMRLGCFFQQRRYRVVRALRHRCSPS